MRTIKNVDPAMIPNKTLPSGDKIPGIGLGTFGSDKYSPDEVANAVKFATQIGYRHIDCASVYKNEHEIGIVLNQLINQGNASREELFITSKVWNDMHYQVEESCLKSLKDLHLDYLDLYLVHWPFPNFHPSGCDVNYRHPDARGYIHEEYMKTWQQMESLVDKGLVRNIGTSNMTIPKLELVLRDARIKPAVNEMELHPHFQQPDLFDYVLEKGIVPIGYSPVGSPARPERDRTEQDTVDIEDPVILKIAEKHHVHPAIICLKWAVQRGQIPIPFSVNKEKIMSNLMALVSDPLTEKEMMEIAGIDKNCRLIKGHVFLWKDGQTWEDLWDIHGFITPN